MTALRGWKNRAPTACRCHGEMTAAIVGSRLPKNRFNASRASGGIVCIKLADNRLNGGAHALGSPSSTTLVRKAIREERFTSSDLPLLRLHNEVCFIKSGLGFGNCRGSRWRKWRIRRIQGKGCRLCERERGKWTNNTMRHTGNHSYPTSFFDAV
jgi:hypothetical protein